MLRRMLRARVELRELARDWRSWCKAIAEAAEKTLGSSRVYVFGSAAEGYATGGSDVDVLVVAGRLPRSFRLRGEIKARIEEEAGLSLYHPFEIHLATWKEAEANPIYREAIEKGKIINAQGLDSMKPIGESFGESRGRLPDRSLGQR